MDLIGPSLLVQFMRYRDKSAKTLAEAVTRAGVQTSKATIGHLMTGHVKSTSPDRAKAIARVLDVPVATLFVTKVSTVQRDVSPGRRVA